MSQIFLQIKDDQAILRCKVSSTLLAVLPGIEGRRSWIREGGEAKGLTFEPSTHNLSVLSALPGFKDALLQINAKSSPARAFRTKERPPKTVPRPHQTKALERIGDNASFAVFADQGTGKTKIAIDWSVQLYDEGAITGCLVVSKKGVHRQFAEEQLEEHCAADYFATFWGQKKSTIRAPRKPVLEYATINYDAIKHPRGRDWATEFCKRHRGKLLIIADESQEIKNVKSGRWNEMASLKLYSSHRLLLTGTPIARDLTDEWSQLLWLNENILGIRYITTFRSEFCVMGGFDGKQVIGHKNLQRFREITSPHVFRITKEELDLPPKQYKTWKFDMSDAQISAINEIRGSSKKSTSRGDISQALMRVQQVSNGYLYKTDDDEEFSFFSNPEQNPRIQAATEWLNSFDGKALIWCRFKKDIAILRCILGSKAVYHSGEVSDSERKRGIESFMDRGGARILVANPQSAGTGLNLQGLCNNVLYYSNSFNAIDRWQSEDRVHRIGTVGTVLYTDLIADGGVDRYIITNLRKKKGISDLAIGDLEAILADVGRL